MNKPLILLLPGLLCDKAVWEAQIGALQEVATCLVPDYGLLDSIEGMAGQALSLAGGRSFALAGHSMGGRVALEIMRRAPDQVQRLALLDTGFQPLASGPAGEQERVGRMALLARSRSAGMRAMGEQWARGMVHPEHVGAPVFQAILDMIARSTPDQFEAQIRALLARPDATAVLAAVRCPTLLLCGRQDAWSPLARHEEMQRHIRGSDLKVIEQSGHMTTMEQPQAVTSLLREWIDRTPAT